MNGAPIIDIQGLTKRFSGRTVVDHVDLGVRRGEIVGFLGPNGAGKSSMLNCINGVYRPQVGSITFRGQTFSHMDSHQVASMGIGRTFQNLALFKGMSVLDNIMSGRNLKIKSNILMQALRIGPAEREEIQHREAVERIIDFLEIQAYRKTPVGQLPYGLQKRVDLGRALAMEPQVLLMDEPFGALDALTRAKLQDELLAIVANTQSTVVMVTHDVDEAVLLSDKIVMMTNGPAATIGEVLHVELPRPRSRVTLADDAAYLHYRKAVIDFLYTRQAHVEKH